MPKLINALPGAATMPVPSDFNPDIQVTNRAIVWRGEVELHGFPGGVTQNVPCETGYGFREDSPERREGLRREVFLLMEAGRQGNGNAIAYARLHNREGRHPGRGKRPISQPQVEKLSAPKDDNGPSKT